jgi:hypothetical protein
MKNSSTIIRSNLNRMVVFMGLDVLNTSIDRR